VVRAGAFTDEDVAPAQVPALYEVLE